MTLPTSENLSPKPDQPAAKKGLALNVLPSPFAICRLAPDADIPDWAQGGAFISISRSAKELSVICEQRQVPDSVRSEKGWSAIQIVEPLGEPIIGVLSTLAHPLTDQGISLFAVSTFESDYVFVRRKKLHKAIKALEAAGHAFPERKQSSRAKRKRKTSAKTAPASAAPTPSDQPRQVLGKRPEQRRQRPLASAQIEPAPAASNTAQPAPSIERQEPQEPTSLPRREEPRKAAPSDDIDEGAVAAGLFTGAIPQQDVATTETSFASLGLSQPVLNTIARIGFEHPTPIQASVVPEALTGKDIIGLAETGSGKTAAFVLPLVEQLGRRKGRTRGLILCPTREIALQTKAFLDVFSKEHQLESLTIIGGVKMGPQIQGLKRGADILVATPGRLADHLRRRNARLGQLEQLVLDEADHMLDLGFLPQIQEILEQVPEDRQTMMFSATMPPPIARLAGHFMKDPLKIDFRPEGHMAEGIEHRLYLLQNSDDKKQCLLGLLEEVEGSTLVFTRRRLDAEWLSRQLEQAGVPVERIHSDRSQAHRVRALRAFREGRHRVLVATDVAARGIDIPRIEHVINFELPDQVEDYVHRAGRTARGNAVGIVSSICSWQDKPMVKEIELELGMVLPRHKTEGIPAFVEAKRRKNVRRRRLL